MILQEATLASLASVSVLGVEPGSLVLTAVAVLCNAIAAHAEASSGNDAFVQEAGRRADAAHRLMTSLAGATFPDNHPSLARVVDVLIDLETRARMWCESSMLSRHLAFSRLGISKACKYRDNFQQLFALLDRALQELMSTVKVESNCNLSELQAQLSQEFSAAAAAAGERAASQTEALQKLGGQSASLDALLAKSRTQAIALAELETRLDSILESLKTDLAAGAQVVLVAAKAAAAVAEAMEQHESSGGGGRRGAEDNTDEIVAALTANILNLVVPELLEKLEADGKLTSEAVKSAKEAVLGEVHGVESTERAARERLNRFEALSQCRGVDMASVYRYEPYNFDDPDDQEKASLGEGQFGETFRMLNMNDMVVYAVKLVNLKKAKLEEAQVKKESKVLGQLYHPNIVRYYGCFYYGKKNKFWAIAMEYLSGGSLLAKMKSSPKPTPKQRLRWVLEIASALAHMHEHNVQHRDLKPDNVLFASEAPNARVVVIDLGLACLNLAKSKASKAVGAEMYRSPEKALGERYGPADDVWVLGLIAACLALGQPLEDWIEESGGSGGLFALNRSKVNKFVAEAVALCPSLGALAAALLIQDASLRPTAASVAESKGDAAALVRPSVSPDAITEEQEENEDDGKVAIDRKWKLEAEARVREAEARAREAEARAKAAEAEARALAAEAEVQRLREAKQEENEKAKREEEAKAKREADEKAKQEANEKAKREEAAKREADEKAKQEVEEKAKREEAKAKAKREADEKAKQEANEKAKREEAKAKAKREAEELKVAEACAAVGHPMGSKWCWTSSDARIAAGEVGTVVGYSHEHGQVRVKFSKGTWPLAQLITLEAWQEREAAKREEQKVNDACDAIGRPMGSTWCWTLSNDDIAAGEVGTVVGFLHGQGKVQVKFSKVTWPFAPDQLITVVAWQKRIAAQRAEAKAMRKAARIANPKAAAAATKAIFKAAMKGEEELVKKCIAEGANVDEFRDEYGNAALTVATIKGETATVQLLVDAGADTEAVGKDGFTALHHAFFHYRHEIVQLLIDATELDRITAAKVIFYAAMRGKEELVKKCIAEGANVDECRDLYGMNALMYASENGHTAVVQLLLEAGADINAKNFYGDTALTVATVHRKIGPARLLVDAGADMEVEGMYNCTTLIVASEYGCRETVQLLIHAGANKGATTGRGGTALMAASKGGRTATVQLLLEAGFDKEAKDEAGWTALIWASIKGHTSTVKLLLDAGADKEAKTNDGKTALDVAKKEKELAVVSLLEKYK